MTVQLADVRSFRVLRDYPSALARWGPSGARERGGLRSSVLLALPSLEVLHATGDGRPDNPVQDVPTDDEADDHSDERHCGVRSFLGGLGQLAQPAGSRTIMRLAGAAYHLSRTGSVRRRRSRSRRDAVGALDRFRETSTIAAGGSGSALLPGPRRCHLLNLARLLVLVALLLVDSCGLLFFGAVPWAARVRRWARCGVVVAGTTCGQVPGLTAARRAAVTRSRSGGGGASEPAPRPETNKSRGRTVTRLRLALPGCPRCDHSRSPVPLQHAHAMSPVGMPSSD
jgi:hypothetical protein